MFDWQALNELMYHEQKTSSRSNDELEDNLWKENPTQLSVSIDHYIDGHYIWKRTACFEKESWKQPWFSS